MTVESEDPQTLRALIKSAGMTNSRASKALGIDRRTLTRYLSGKLEIKPMVVLAMRYLVHIGGKHGKRSKSMGDNYS
jgi:hypothetical protein